MTTISVVVPNITGREDLLDRCRAAYKQHSDGVRVEWIVAKDQGGAGHAWNAGASQATGDYLHLTCDDMLPHAGWADVAISAAEQGVYPAPRILKADGELQNCGTLGSGMMLGEVVDGTPVNASELPFLSRDLWQPGMVVTGHYYSDDWMGVWARHQGLSVEVRRDYLFTHLEGRVGRERVAGRPAMEDRDRVMRAATDLYAV